MTRIFHHNIIIIILGFGVSVVGFRRGRRSLPLLVRISGGKDCFEVCDESLLTSRRLTPKMPNVSKVVNENGQVRVEASAVQDVVQTRVRGCAVGDAAS